MRRPWTSSSGADPTTAFHGSTGSGDPHERRLAFLAVLLVAAFVGVAIAKPWSAGSDGTTPSETAAADVSTAGPDSPSPPTPMTQASTPHATPVSTPVSVGPSSTESFVTPGPVTTPWTGLHWVRLRPDDPLSLVTMVRRWSGGYVAVGWDPGAGRSTPVWSSRDGATWRPIPFNTSTSFWPGMMILGIAPVPDGVVAIGRVASDCGGACPTSYSGPVVAWTSRDGYRWSPHVVPEQWLSAATPSTGPPVLAAGPRGLVVGVVGSARFATSMDGVRWQPANAAPYPRSFSLFDIEGTTSGYVAVGQNGTPGSGRVAAQSWSADGRSWSTPAALPGSSDVGRASTADAILVADAGAIAIGRVLTTPGATLWWRSRDGRRWSSLPTFAPLGASDCVGEGCGLQPAGGLVADGTRIVGVGFDRATRAWTTTDAASWSPLDMFGDVPDPDAQALALLPSGVLVTGGGTSWLGVAVSR